MSAVYEVVEIARVRANPEHIREDLGDLDQLSREIKTMGVRSPLVVYPHPELEGDFMLRDGHRRRQAAINAGLLNVPVVIEEASARGALLDIETMLTTGATSKLNTRMEEAKGYQRMLDLGLNESTIGKRLTRPKSEVVTLGRVTKAPEKVQAAFSKGRIDLLQLKKLTDLQAAGQTEVLDRALDSREFNTNSEYKISADRIIAEAQTEQQAADDAERLLALGGKQIDREQAYSLTEVTEDPELTEEEHVAAEHLFYIPRGGGVVEWYLKTFKPKVTVSDEVKAEKAKLREINAGLQTSFTLRQQFLVEQIQSKDGAGEAADKEMLFGLLWGDITKLHDDLLGDITGIRKPDDVQEYTEEYTAWKARVRTAMQKLSWRQLARAAAFGDDHDTDRQMRRHTSFERESYDWTRRRGWLSRVQRLFGYRLDEAELAAVEFYKVKGGTYSGRNTEGENRDLNEDLIIIDDVEVGQ